MALIETARTRNVLVCGYYGEHNLVMTLCWRSC